MSSPTHDSTALPSSTQRGVISLLLFMHLFCVVAVVLSVLRPSPLQLRLANRLRPYTQTLNFQITFLPYYLTHATRDDVDHRIEVLPKEADAAEAASWTILPGEQFAGSESHHRYQRFATVMNVLATDDAVVSRLAKSTAEHFLHDRDVELSQVRSRRHLLQSPEEILQGLPETDAYYETGYAANVVLANGEAFVVRQESAREVARPETAQGGDSSDSTSTPQ